MTDLVLVGMGIDAPSYDNELAAIAAAAGGTHAYLQLGAPALAAVLDRLRDADREAIVLVPIARDRGTVPGVSWLRRVAAHWWRELEGSPRPSLAVAQRVHRFAGEAEPTAQLQPLAPLVAGAREVTGSEPGLTSSAWEEVPRHRHQVLVCRGPRCSAQRADLTATAIAAELERCGLGDEDVLLTQTGCQFPCNHAPVVVVQPDDVWYGGIGPGQAEAIVEQHLVAGSPLTEHRLPRTVAKN
ncbi:MAG: (2Fe-2S) ferredoxin domain-containing protein [Nocardioidaceae bacterium]|nr:(2Fe-2S) ferredoxin domain-containing protein [Nocardioidaceae bacterium]